LYKFNLHSYKYTQDKINQVADEDHMLIQHLAKKYPEYHYRYMKEEYKPKQNQGRV
tara:strand:- start:213 stop:380 length:168 start_codon:yes stop_codon:yes gene_type:complete